MVFKLQNLISITAEAATQSKQTRSTKLVIVATAGCVLTDDRERDTSEMNAQCPA